MPDELNGSDAILTPKETAQPLDRSRRPVGIAGALLGVGLLVGTLFFALSTLSGSPPLPPEAQLTAAPLAGPPSSDISPLDQRGLYPTREHVTQTVRLRRNSTLITTLTKAGVAHGDAAKALQTLYDQNYLDPKRLRAGLEVTITTATSGDLIALSLAPGPGRTVITKRQSDGSFLPALLTPRLTAATHRIAAEIDTSLYNAVLSEGGRDQHVADFAQIFAFDVDFQREIHPGDTFELVYETLVDEKGTPVRNGEIVFAALNGKVVDKTYYRHTPSDDGVVDYFSAKGEAATRFLMKTPINGARLSSRFGRRRHPISGYSRLHKGTDFAAPTGTPIFAAGHGVVERASRYGGYGKYVRIRHANGYKTAYAHMSRYGPGVKSGKRVRQGDIIGYVGSTGASTGPHLHYEVLINGKHVNSQALKLPTGRILEGDLLDAFKKVRDGIDATRVELGAPAPSIFLVAETGDTRHETGAVR